MVFFFSFGPSKPTTSPVCMEKSIPRTTFFLPKALNKDEDLISYVKDRLGHDRRYAIDPSKIEKELGWRPQYTFDTGIVQTIKWNIDNKKSLSNVESGEYLKWMERYR